MQPITPGANLETILKQDHHLPETMVRSVALDVFSALHFLHSLGIICCDIQPAKVLLNTLLMNL